MLTYPNRMHSLGTDVYQYTVCTQLKEVRILIHTGVLPKKQFLLRL